MFCPKVVIGWSFPTIAQWLADYALRMDNQQRHNLEFRRKLGVRIAQLRAEKGMSQRKFALVLELDRVTLNRIESGQGNPTLSTLERIAGGLDVTVEELLGA